MVKYIFKGCLKFFYFIINAFEKAICHLLFIGNSVRVKSFKTNGIPYIMVALGGDFTIGNNFQMNNGIRGNPIGCYNRCTFFVDKNAKLDIGDNVGISQSALICHDKITIGNNVKIGGGVKIYDTDFHSLNPLQRNSNDDLKFKKTAAIIIEENVFVGGYSIILKGVTIGKNSIIGAGSVVTKDIPPNEIWGGNPATFIRQF